MIPITISLQSKLRLQWLTRSRSVEEDRGVRNRYEVRKHPKRNCPQNLDPGSTVVEEETLTGAGVRTGPSGLSSTERKPQQRQLSVESSSVGND
jgi:hypothetical protein